jgi:hypothetical protein
MAPAMFTFTSSIVFPVETHPSRSGTRAPKLFGERSITTAYSIIAFSVPTDLTDTATEEFSVLIVSHRAGTVTVPVFVGW